MTQLKDKIVFITGASAGIGEATARRFAAEGARLILAARRADRLQKLSKSLGVECLTLEMDVRDHAAVEKTVAGLPESWKAIEILVNNAGLSRGLWKLHQGEIDGWNDMIDTNVKGLLHVSRAVIPGMVARGRGHVVNIGSIAGRELYPGGNVYCATKFAVRALTKGMLIDLVDTPVRVTSIDPGLVETEFSEVRFYGDRERARTVYQGYKPLSGDDIADAIIWAVSRPEHVNIAEMTVLPKAQAGALIVNKRSG